MTRAELVRISRQWEAELGGAVPVPVLDQIGAVLTRFAEWAAPFGAWVTGKQERVYRFLDQFSRKGRHGRGDGRWEPQYFRDDMGRRRIGNAPSMAQAVL